MHKVIQIISIQRHQRSRVIRFPKQRRLEIRRTVGRPCISDIDGGAAEQVLGIHCGDGGGETGLDAGQALEVGERTSVIGYGVTLKDLGGDGM